ncbi:chorismate mutase [Streptomyces sp. NBC_00247]|uniref:chorismate mutase n=1 Tax=Streptomyces sp. NBC_00247 TaxID=2975689 RepID=UPI002E2DA97C|nr:chorismate mutase [Streptomyces sp. NBC_00247]
MIERLRKDGYPVRAIANPLQGLTSDTAYVSSYLSTYIENRGGPLNLRRDMTRYAAITGFLGAATVLAVPQVTAAGFPATAGPVRSAERTAKPLGPLTDLVIQRIRVGDDVAASKFGTDSPIEDPVREAQVLEQVRTQAEAAGVNPQAAVAFFQDQITASKVVQQGLFARWTAHPEEAPTTRPDLGPIRAQLDQLTTDLLQELKNTEGLRDRPVACTVQLALATGSSAVRERLDVLHRQTLRTATQSVCG